MGSNLGCRPSANLPLFNYASIIFFFILHSTQYISPTNDMLIISIVHMRYEYKIPMTGVTIDLEDYADDHIQSVSLTMFA